MPSSLLSVPGTPGATGWRPGSVSAPGRSEQAGGLVAGLDVAHDGARGLVPGLGHDQLQRDLLVAEVGRGGVTKLVEVQVAGVLLEQDPGAVVAQAAPAGVRADVTGRGPAGGDGPAGGQEQRPAGARGAVGQAQQPGQQVRGPGV
jgi:hypothetical protein